MKKLLTVLIGFALVAGSASSVRAADIPDEQWVKSGPTEEGGSWGIAMTDDIGNESPIGFLTSIKADGYNWGVSKQLAIKVCTSYPTTNCPSDEYQSFQTPIGYCRNELDTDCVADIFAEKSDGTKLEYKFVRNFPDENPYAFRGNAIANLPASGNTFLIDIPGAPHAGGTLYFVSSVLAGNRMPNESTFRTDRLNVSITAVSLKSGNFYLPSPITDISRNGFFPSVGRAGDTQCAIQCSKTEVALGQAMDLNLKLGVKIRLNAKVTGWLNGRVSNVDSSISINSRGMQEIVVKGNPVKVPVIFGWVKKAAAPQSLKDYYGAMTAAQVNGGNGFGKCLDPALPIDAPPGPCNPVFWESVLRGPQKNLQDLKEVALWLPVLKDTAVVAPTRWNINSTDGGVIGGCSADSTKLTGIVTTNATGFVSGPPEFNRDDQALEYKVLAPHYLKDGSVFKGTYDLAIDSQFARCIYGFTSAPISAKVSIISNDGENQVATVVTSERDGWIHLGAYGFTFSSPTVRVKLSQSTPTPVAVATANPIPNKSKKTITCLKGKLTKVVSGVNPKCPIGYKKKVA